MKNSRCAAHPAREGQGGRPAIPRAAAALNRQAGSRRRRAGGSVAAPRRGIVRDWRGGALLRLAIVVLLPFGLGGCLARVATPVPAATVGVATVPSSFFAATPAVVPPPDPPAGRYTVGAIVALAATDPRAAYAAPALGPSARFVQIALRADDLAEPRAPAVAYELVTDSGIVSALAEGEWERAVGDGPRYSQRGRLLFALPRDQRAGRLEIVDYYYPRLAPGLGATPASSPPLVRRVLASFVLDRLP